MSTGFSLAGRAVAVTGAGRGNGRAIALALARLGAYVHVLDIDSALASQTQALISAAGGRSEFFVVDVGDRSSCHNWVSHHLSPGQPLYGLVNNAGLIVREPLTSPTATDNFSKVMDVNLRGAFLMTMACLDSLKQSK
ncbi:MAG: SDR family NAD(P)-dependent oxidoreductase, partial [Betaproteobacteria bacterium]|nr:SDR family NAD(P)-dependent oxidoreductase [Betaproteobacteria bacterium]